MLNQNLSYDEWIFIFDKAKALKSNIVLVGIRGLLIGFDESLSILRTIDIPMEYDLPAFSFMPKDLKPIYDAVENKPVRVDINKFRIEVQTEKCDEWIIHGEGNVEYLYPNMIIRTDPFELKKLYDLYLNMKTITNRDPSEYMGNMKNSDIIAQYNALKADSGNIIYRHGNHSLVLFYGWFKMNKSDDIFISFYDIPNTTNFVTKIDIVKSKGKETVTTYTMNFNIISTIPF